MIGLTNEFGSVEAAILYSFIFIFLFILCWDTSEERFALFVSFFFSFLFKFFSRDVMMELNKSACVVSKSVRLRVLLSPGL